MVPVDFSKHSEYALEVASKIAKQHEMGIVILHMLRVSESVLSKLEEEERQEIKYYLKLAKEKINKFTAKDCLKEVSVGAIVQNYKLFEEVSEVAQEQNCGLIVMGSHGTSGLSDFFVGSNTEKVVRSSGVPVLVIKKHHEDYTVKKMIFACDLNPENVSAYKKALAFATLYGASLEIIYVNTAAVNYMGYSDFD